MSKKTLAAIAESGNDYLVKVKTNQPTLYKQIETESNQQPAKQTVEHHEKTRNRNSYRKVEVFEPPKNLDPLWVGVGSVIKVERGGTRANEPYQRISYYLCSLSPQSRRLADGIRGHWLIEREGRWGFPSGRVPWLRKPQQGRPACPITLLKILFTG